MPARILIVDDHRLTAHGARSLLMARGYEVDVMHRAAEVAERLHANSFDVALVDMVFDREPRSGIDVIETIVRCSPKTAIVLFTAGDDARKHHIASALVRFPVRGGIPKDSLPDTLFECVDSVLQGDTFFDPEIEAFRPANKRDPSEELLPTPAHAAIWCALAEGCTSREEIKRVSNYSRRTIGNAIGPMGEKLYGLGLTRKRLTSLAELAAYAAEHRYFFLNWKWRQNR